MQEYVKRNFNTTYSPGDAIIKWNILRDLIFPLGKLYQVYPLKMLFTMFELFSSSTLEYISRLTHLKGKIMLTA